MKMKKFISFAAVAAMVALGMTSCDDTDNGPQFIPTEISDGVFVLNSGNQSGKIDGTITYYDYATGEATQNMYQAANQKSLGVTIPGAVVYGSKIYIVGSVESTVFIADRKTLKEIATDTTQIKDEEGKVVKIKGRGICAGEGKVFVATYNNTVFAIDTLTNKICKEYKSGDYSDGICYSNGYLYTGDTAYGKYGTDSPLKPSVTKINVATGESTIIKNEGFRNPTDIVCVDGRIFVQDKGYYDKSTGKSIQVDQNLFELNPDGSIGKSITPASTICASNDKIYIIYYPYGAGKTPVYKVYDVKTDKLDTFCEGKEVLYPNKISVDPVKNIVYITSYQYISGTTNPDYKADCFVAMYDANTGKFLKTFNCGVGGGAVVPNSHIEIIKK